MTQRFRMPKFRRGAPQRKRLGKRSAPTIPRAQLNGWRRDYAEEIRHQQAEHAQGKAYAMCGEHDDAALCFRRAAEHGAAAARIATAIRRYADLEAQP